MRQSTSENSPRRVGQLLAILATVLAIFVLRLFQLQVIEYSDYATQSEGNAKKPEIVLAPRGVILDRHGEIIAENRLARDLWYEGGEVLFKDRIVALLGLDSFPERGSYADPVYANVPDELVPPLMELLAGQPNLKLVERIERYYPNPISGPVVGYVRRANADEVASGYDPRNLVGAAGLEQALEPVLRGKDGLRLLEVDAHGDRVREDLIREPVPGRTVRLTIDLEVQKATEKALVEAIEELNLGRRRLGQPEEQFTRGAIVAVEPSTGEVLAMASAPGFDPNLFARGPVSREVTGLMSDPALPLLNRAVEPFTPGSTYKLLTSSALLESGTVEPTTTYPCPTGIGYGGRWWRNWATRHYGTIDVRGAIALSCNTWYYQAVINADTRAMVDVIHDRAIQLGFTQPTGLEIEEKTGLLPSQKWKQETFNEPWYPGETLSVAIGQGATLATPVQLARLVATIANAGSQPELHLVAEKDGKLTEAKMRTIPGKYWTVIQEGMRKTVAEGTSRHRLGDFPVPTAGKTGTAQTPGKAAGYEHAWYVGYGPTEPGITDKRLVVVAFFQNGGEGSLVALPAVRKVMEAYWRDVPEVKTMLAEREE